MKKLIFAAAASLSLLFTGCGDAADESSLSSEDNSSISNAEVTEAVDNTEASEEVQTTVEETEAPESGDEILAAAENYSVVKVPIQNDVYYPQITGLEDSAVQDKVNEFLKSIEQGRYDEMQAMVDQAMVQYNEASEAGELTDEMIAAYDQIQSQGAYFAEPEVNYADNDKISIVQHAWFGYDSIEEARNQELSSSTTTINLNMKTGEELQITDLCDPAEAADKIYNNNGVEIIKGYDGASIDDFLAQPYISSVEDLENYITKSFSLNDKGEPVFCLNSGKGSIFVTVK